MTTFEKCVDRARLDLSSKTFCGSSMARIQMVRVAREASWINNRKFAGRNHRRWWKTINFLHKLIFPRIFIRLRQFTFHYDKSTESPVRCLSFGECLTWGLPSSMRPQSWDAEPNAKHKSEFMMFFSSSSSSTSKWKVTHSQRGTRTRLCGATDRSI